MRVCLSFSANETGGEYYHKLTQRELPQCSIDVNIRYTQSDLFPWTMPKSGFVIYNGHGYLEANETYVGGCTYFGYTDPLGNDVAHNNIQPYVVTYMFRRIS